MPPLILRRRSSCSRWAFGVVLVLASVACSRSAPSEAGATQQESALPKQEQVSKNAPLDLSVTPDGVNASPRAVSPDGDKIPLNSSTSFLALSASSARDALTQPDGFISAMSGIDRQLRLGSSAPVTEAQLLEHIGGSAQAWSDEEILTLKQAATALNSALVREGVVLELPAEIPLIKTSGVEEPGWGYTRGAMVILNTRSDSQQITKLLTHELFHVLTRENPELRDRLYELIGFKKITRITYPESLAELRLTNPDAPFIEHAITIEHEGAPVLAAPVLYAKLPYQGGAFFDHLIPKLLVVDQAGVAQGDPPTLIGYDEASGFFEQVGRNTPYIIHPEEILAENFVALLFPPGSVNSPQIVEGLRAALIAK